MITKAQGERFEAIQTADFGDPHQLQDDRRKVLWVLATAKADPELSYLTPAQISDILRECEGINISRQKAAAILKDERGTVVKRRISEKSHFKIMKIGEDQLNASSLTSVFVDPEKALTEIRRIEDLLSKLNGSLKVCDPYVDNRTLDFLAECNSAKNINLLTVNVLKESRFRRDLTAFRREHGNLLNVRVATQSHLHDRYIIHDEGMLLLGTSLNGFAKKQSFVVALGADLRAAAETVFDRNWASATKF